MYDKLQELVFGKVYSGGENRLGAVDWWKTYSHHSQAPDKQLSTPVRCAPGARPSKCLVMGLFDDELYARSIVAFLWCLLWQTVQCPLTGLGQVVLEHLERRDGTRAVSRSGLPALMKSATLVEISHVE